MYTYIVYICAYYLLNKALNNNTSCYYYYYTIDLKVKV